MLRIVILLTCLCEGRGHSYGDSEIYKNLTTVIQQFCPGVNICSMNESVSASSGNSCCEECSCEPDCSINGNCCFPERLASNQDVNERIRDFPTERTCLYPMTPQPNEDEKMLYQSLIMVSSIGKNVLDNSTGKSNSSCGDANVAPWGSLYPVYSARSKQVYKNLVCAQENDISDGIIWDAVINCISDEVIGAMIALESNTFPESCIINFIYPGDYDDLQTSKCDLPFIDKCPQDPNFQMPEWTSLSKRDIVILCESGLVAPYRVEKKYANVFCHICNAEGFSSFCEKKSDGRADGIISKGFTALIDDGLITRTNGNYQTKAGAVPRVCAFEESIKCQNVFCPAGQIRNEHGSCIYAIKVWYNQFVGVYINLTSDELINMADMFKIKFGMITSALPPLDSPWDRHWSIINIYYKVTDIEHFSNNFIVLIGTKKRRENPSRIIRYIKKMISRPWLAHMNNDTIVLRSNGFATFTSGFGDAEKEIMSVSDTIKKTPEKSLYYLIGLYSSSLDMLIITKMYVCEQVELNQSEFFLSQDEVILYNYRTLRFLFNGEFVVTWNNVFEGPRVRICIDDSGLNRSTSSLLVAQLSVMFMCLCVFVSVWTDIVGAAFRP